MSMFHCGEWGERDQETERVKWNLNVFVNHRENAVCACQRKREKVRKKTTEGKRERERERDKQRVCS